MTHQNNRRVEMHTHMFNGKYVPLEEFLYYRFFKDIPSIFARPAAIALGKILRLCIDGEKPDTYKAAPDIFKLIQTIDDENPGESAKIVSNFTTDILFLPLENLIKGGIARVDLNQVVKLLKHVNAIQNLLSVYEQETAPDHSFDEDQFYDDLKSDIQGVKKRAFKGQEYYYSKTKGYFRFILKMLISDDDLFSELVNGIYPESQNVGRFVHLTMDIEAAYLTIADEDDVIKPEYPFVKGIEESEKFIRQSEGKLSGFVAFHPERGSKGLEFCISEVKKGTHIGIKIYPPLNYRPDGVCMPETENREEVKDYKELMTSLYTVCEADSIPVLTHCTPEGFEPWAHTGPLSNPVFWENVLRDHKKLKLCFGHGGGGDFKYLDYYTSGQAETLPKITTDGWYAPPEQWNHPNEINTNYAKRVVMLCNTYPNVYADLSYLCLALSDEGKKTNLLRNLEQEITSGERFAQRVIYGSDWHMADILSKTDAYLKMFDDFFNDRMNANQKADFFYHNATRFLNGDI